MRNPEPTPVSRRPHPGARIETLRSRNELSGRQVAPTRGRGSKPQRREKTLHHDCRPHPGARIETGQAAPRPRAAGRRPHPGARIETIRSGSISSLATSPPPGGADRNNPLTLLGVSSPRRPHPGARIETTKPPPRPDGEGSPPPGGADRNRLDPLRRRGFRRSPPPGGADRNFCATASGRL